MFKRFFTFLAGLLCLAGYSQNDLDAIRYSRVGVGGSSRFVAMGGAFGAIGADLSVAAYNPAGLAVFRKGDINFSGGFRTSGNSASIYGKSNTLRAANISFNNFGIAGAWKAKNDPESRHIFAFTNTQVQNFSSSTRMSGYTNNSSIARDMLNLAEGHTLSELNNSYEGLAYDTYVLDLDSASNSYYSFVDTKRTVQQTRDLFTTGRVNDLNFSYAFTYKDKYYVGASLAFPQVEYSSTTTHTETDDKDSMRVQLTSTGYNTTYIDPLPSVYRDKLGFNSLTYEEYFKTTGGGINLKVGGIVRVNDALRVGAYFHSPTIYRLTDQYYSSMSTTFDLTKGKPDELTYPENGGTFSYKVYTPSKLGLNAAIIVQKLMVIGVDYELLNYRKTYLSSATISDFAGVNNVIQKKYTTGQNVKVGVEVNLDPFKARMGYSMNGSPFGEVFSGDFVRNTYSLGAGYRTKNNFYFDLVWSKTVSSETYYLYNTLETKARINYNLGMVGLTVGVKF